jgi:hypothetical protein
MKGFLFIAGLAAVSLAQTPQKLPPQKIIDDYMRAEGGSKMLVQIRTETIAGNLTDEAAGKTGSYSLIVKAPDRFYSEIVMEPDHTVEAYNGMSAWRQNSAEGARSLTGEAAKEAEAAGRYWNGRLADVKKDKQGLQLMGVEKVRGRDAYHIRVLLGPGVARDVLRDVFFDTQTHLIARETTPEQQFDYDDYRPVQGTQTPYRIELHRGGHDYKIAVTRAEFNAPVDDAVFSFPRAATIPLPDMKALFLEVGRNQKAIEQMQKQYTCHLISEEQGTASKGQETPKTIREFEVFHVGDGEVRRLVAIAGKPLPADVQRKEDDRFNKQFEEQTKRQAKEEAELARNPKKREKEGAEDESDLFSLLRAIRFSNPRRERFRGQDVIAVDFGANPDYKPKKMMEGIAQKMAGVIWIDEQAHDVARMEAHFRDSAKIVGGVLASLDKGSNMVVEQAKVNGEVWLPVYDEVHFAGRVLFLKARANQIDRYTDCKKFHAESKFTAGQDQ